MDVVGILAIRSQQLLLLLEQQRERLPVQGRMHAGPQRMGGGPRDGHRTRLQLALLHTFPLNRIGKCAFETAVHGTLRRSKTPETTDSCSCFGGDVRGWWAPARPDSMLPAVRLDAPFLPAISCGSGTARPPALASRAATVVSVSAVQLQLLQGAT